MTLSTLFCFSSIIFWSVSGTSNPLASFFYKLYTNIFYWFKIKKMKKNKKENKVKFKGGGFDFSNNKNIEVKLKNIDLKNAGISSAGNSEYSFDANNVNIANDDPNKSSTIKKIIIGIIIAVIAGVIIELII